MRILALATAGLLTALPLSAQLPAGWASRTDTKGAEAGVKFSAMGPGYHVTTGSALVLWRDADKVTGGFHTLATFTQTKAPTHPEGYGIFIAGSDLAGDGVKYTYFLVRADGKFIVKQRDGAATPKIADWTDSDAIVKADASGKATNKIEVYSAAGNKVEMKINDKMVYSWDAKGPTPGMIGLRVNHGLDVHVEGFAVHRTDK